MARSASTTLAVLGILVLVSTVQADEPAVDKEGSKAPGSEKGEGTPSVSSSGTLSMRIPLELPPPRGSVPLPISIDYGGSTDLGELGMGWGLQRNSIRRSSGYVGRPDADATFDLSLLGSGSRLIEIPSFAGSMRFFRPAFSPSNWLVVKTVVPGQNWHNVWTLYDDAGRVFVFKDQPRYSDEAVLVEVRDADGNVLELQYGIAERSYGYIHDFHLANDQYLLSVKYSFRDEPNVCPKHRIMFDWEDAGDVGTRWPVYGPAPRRDDAAIHAMALSAIRIEVAADTICNTYERLNTYLFSYESHADIGLPVLRRVDQLGRGELDASKALPLWSYEYGNLTGGGKVLNLVAGQTITLPPGVSGPFFLSRQGPKGIKELGDFTGDGLPDLLISDDTVSEPAKKDPATMVSTARARLLYRGMQSAMGKLDLVFDTTGQKLLTGAAGMSPLPIPYSETGHVGPDQYTTTAGYRFDSLTQYIDWDADGSHGHRDRTAKQGRGSDCQLDDLPEPLRRRRLEVGANQDLGARHPRLARQRDGLDTEEGRRLAHSSVSRPVQPVVSDEMYPAVLGQLVSARLLPAEVERVPERLCRQHHVDPQRERRQVRAAVAADEDLSYWYVQGLQEDGHYLHAAGDGVPGQRVADRMEAPRRQRRRISRSRAELGTRRAPPGDVRQLPGHDHRSVGPDPAMPAGLYRGVGGRSPAR